MKHILHVVTNNIDQILLSTLQSHIERPDITTSIITTEPLPLLLPSQSHANVHILSESPNNATSPDRISEDENLIGYDHFLDLVFEAETTIIW